jgi:hypothetical protein
VRALYLFPLSFTASSSFAAAVNVDSVTEFFAGFMAALLLLITARLAVDALLISYEFIRELLIGRSISRMSDDEYRRWNKDQ